MNSPPEEFSPSPSSPSSSSPPPDDLLYQTSSQTTLNPFVSASPSQTKRRLPPSSSSHLTAREGRENKSRRKETDRDDAWKSGRSWESRGDNTGTTGSSRTKDDLIDMHVVEHMRKTYGDPLES